MEKILRKELNHQIEIIEDTFKIILNKLPEYIRNMSFKKFINDFNGDINQVIKIYEQNDINFFEKKFLIDILNDSYKEIENQNKYNFYSFIQKKSEKETSL